MSKNNFDGRLAALEDLRNAPDSPARSAALRKALADRNNYIVAKAARIMGHLGLKDLIPDLVAAIDRFFTNPVKSDPQCWAKDAIVEALAKLDHDDSTVFIRGLRHVQMEPVWGGQQDSAGPLRGECALALVQCRNLRDSDVLSHLIEALADRETTVRIDAARAIGRIGGDAPALLLRLRALIGDGEPEVVGACLTSLLGIQGEAGSISSAAFFRKPEMTLAKRHSPWRLYEVQERSQFSNRHGITARTFRSAARCSPPSSSRGFRRLSTLSFL